MVAQQFEYKTLDRPMYFLVPHRYRSDRTGATDFMLIPLSEQLEAYEYVRGSDKSN